MLPPYIQSEKWLQEHLLRGLEPANYVTSKLLQEPLPSDVAIGQVPRTSTDLEIDNI